VHELVRLTVTTYTTENTTDRISFEEWNGDRIAGFIESGLLQEGLLTRRMRSSFRKAVAMSDEPDTSFAHFSTLIQALVAVSKGTSDKERITAARQICICLSILFVWARDAGNVESPYLASELALLSVWHITHDMFGGTGRSADAVGSIIQQLAELHFRIWEELIASKILPHAGEMYAISAAVRSSSPIDVNLRLFDLLGRIALRGLWLIWGEPESDTLPAPRRGRVWEPRIDELAQRMCALVAANPALLSPVSDDQVIDLTLAFMFLAAQGGAVNSLKDWITELVARARYAFRNHMAYPCIYRDYRDLLDHPKERTDLHRKAATAASVLWPTLAFWTAGLGDTVTLKAISEFSREYLSHCSFQLWLPDESSEEHIYTDDQNHGAALTDIPVTDKPQEILRYVLKECGAVTPFFHLSAVELGHWPLVAMACRHYRLPIPPHLWLGLLPGVNGLGDEQAAPSVA